MLLTTCNWFFLWLFVGKIKALSIIISQFYGASHTRYILLNPYNNSVTWVFLSSIYRWGNGFCGSSKVNEKGTGTLKHKLPDAKDSFHCTIVSYLKDPEEVSKEVVKETFNLKKFLKRIKIMIQTCLTIADYTSACKTYHNQPLQWKISQFLYYCSFVKGLPWGLEEFAEFMLQSSPL